MKDTQSDRMEAGRRAWVRALHRKKKVRGFPVPSWDVNTKLSLGGNNDVITELFLPSGSLISDIPAGDGKLVNLFLRCVVQYLHNTRNLGQSLSPTSPGEAEPFAQ